MPLLIALSLLVKLLSTTQVFGLLTPEMDTAKLHVVPSTSPSAAINLAIISNEMDMLLKTPGLMSHYFKALKLY